jgi:hypothetical protein
MRARLRALAEQAGLREPEDLADQLLLLMDGAWVPPGCSGPTTRVAGPRPPRVR